MGSVYSIVSGKGGVGKTTFSINLAFVLANAGKDVLLIDSNFTTPNVSLYLKIPLDNPTIHDILKGYSKLEDSIYFFSNGLKVIPGSVSISSLKDINLEKFLEFINEIKDNFDIIILDGAAGLGKEAIYSIKASDSVIAISTNELPSLADCYKVIKVAEELGKKIEGIVLNMVKDKVNVKKIEDEFGYRVLEIIPYSEELKISVKKRIPMVNLYPESEFSDKIRKIASHIFNIPYEKKKEKGILKRIFWFLR